MFKFKKSENFRVFNSVYTFHIKSLNESFSAFSKKIIYEIKINAYVNNFKINILFLAFFCTIYKKLNVK